jgi:predicted alpha/beta hydrolase family esterase
VTRAYHLDIAGIPFRLQGPSSSESCLSPTATFFATISAHGGCADVIFVHGLTGDPVDTWSSDGVTEKEGSYWPRWLVTDLPHLNFYTLGFPASLFAQWAKKEMNLYQRSKNVLELLASYDFGARPIVFVCHSLGGLLVKQILRTAKESTPVESSCCVVCAEPIDKEKEKSKYFELKIDNELQIRESQQLLKAKAAELDGIQNELRLLRREYSASVTEFSGRYDVTNSPRESFLAERNKLLGGLERELGYLEELRATVERIDQLSRERADLNDQIGRLEAKLRSLSASSTMRIRKAMELVGAIGRRLLVEDLPREDAFENPTSFIVNFGDDAMLVDGKMNFAESSNVVLKNSAILSLFLGACYDREFWHPKFLLMDNIEDKGMEQERSHNYQRIIVEESAKAKFPHQIIFTTSMMNPALEGKGLTVGPKYTRQKKTLA